VLPTIFCNINERQVRFFKISAETIWDGNAEEMTRRDGGSSPESSDEMTVHDGRSSPENLREMGSRNVTPSLIKKRIKYIISNLPPHIAWHTRERIGIPLPDFCFAIGYPEHGIRQMLKRNPESFEGYWTILPIPDALGRMQPTIILFEEAIVGLTMMLQASRLKNPAVRQSVIHFKRLGMELIPAIRRGEIKPVRVLNKIEGILPEYYEALQSVGYARAKRIKELAETDGITRATVCRRLKLINGGQNLPTKKGEPKKSPQTKDTHRMPLEARKIIDTYLLDTCLPNKDIWEKSGTRYSYGWTNAILRRFRKEIINA
jgi:hypothetical protein